jgi:hypothetical protein
MKIIAVTAWRHWTDAAFIRWNLLRLHPNYHGAPFHVRVGDADGGDEIVRWWCKERGVSHTVFYADWETHGSHRGSPAGPIRNRQMLAGEGDPIQGRTELLLAFPGRSRPVRVPGSGSWGCCIDAALMGIEVRIPPYSGSGE